MSELLSKSRLEKLPLIDADIRFWREIDLGRSDLVLLDELIDTSPWRQDRITVYGKPYLQPRLSAWFGDLSYRYSGLTLDPQPWTPTLLELKDRVEALTDHDYNSVLLNYYRDQHDSMGMHCDDERELGRQPVIASLSLGERREFLLKHRTRKDLKTYRLPLPSGSLLLMRGETQQHWRHGIGKCKQDCGPRINLTFRKILPGDRLQPRPN